MKNKQFDWITVVPRDSHGGGSESQQINLFTHLNSLGLKCMVICLSKKDMNCWNFIEEKGRVVYFPFPYKYLKVSFILLFPFLIYYFSIYQFKYSFSTQSLINSTFGLLKRIGVTGKTKVIVRESNSIFQLVRGLKKIRYSLGYHLGYPWVDLVICQTHLMKKNLLESMPWLEKKAKVVVIQNPIDLTLIQQKENEVIPGLAASNYIVAAGTLTKKKGFDILINAFDRIKEIHPELVLRILGRGEKRKELLEQIENLGLEDRVILEGFVSNVYPYFRNAKMCVISSRIEGFPNVLLQMMSQNNRIVSTLSAGDIDKIPGIFTCITGSAVELEKSMTISLSSEVGENRKLFDSYLQKRDTNSFLQNILTNL